jgi:hypothetical protein
MLLRRLSLAAVVLAALAALGGGFWVYMAHSLEAGIARWTEDRRAEGWRIGHAGMSVSGFPSRWRARIDKPVATGPGTLAATWTAPVVYVEHEPWRPRHVRIVAPGAQRIDWAGDRTAEFGASHAEALVHVSERGRIQRIDTRFENVTMMPAGYAAIRVARMETGIAPDEAGASRSNPRPGLVVRAELFDLILPEAQNSALGRNIGQISLNATVLGPLAPGRLPEALTIWRDGGGTLEVAKLMLGWGPLSASGDGTLALDEALQPVGAMTAKLAGYEETLQALIQAGIVRAKHGALVNFGLNAIASRPADGGAPYIEAPLTIRDGRLFVGPVALMPMPRIDWAAGARRDGTR